MNLPEVKKQLAAAAHLVQAELKRHGHGVRPLRIRHKIKCVRTETDGWAVTIASLGRGLPRVELWLDHYTGSRPSLWYGFYSRNESTLGPLISATPQALRAKAILDNPEVTISKRGQQLQEPLKANAFNLAVHERYPVSGGFYFGVFTRCGSDVEKSLARWARKAARLVVHAVKHVKKDNPATDDGSYPQWENRKVVRSHLQRERSAKLSLDCKDRDGFRCQACRRGADDFDGLGYFIVESHHIVPLSRLKAATPRRVDDLITVCANCHKMLHQMEGKPEDIKVLKRIVAKEQRKQQRS